MLTRFTPINERKAMLLIGSLSNELDHLCITLIHGKEKSSFKEVCFALLNYEIRKKDKKKHRYESVCETRKKKVFFRRRAKR